MATKTVYIRMNDMTNVDGTPPDFRRKWFFASRAKANRPKHSRGGKQRRLNRSLDAIGIRGRR
jgi:hypothetical protein